MKLIDLLVKELPQRGGWPEGALNATQDKDGEVCFSAGAVPEFGYAAWEGGDWCGNEFHTIRASDYATAIITRDQYESALAASKAVVGHNGWIQWTGGECPVPENSLVEVKYRDGTIRDAYEASGYIWTNGYGDNETTDSDIIAYRLHKPDANSRANNDRLEQDLNECIGQDVVTEWDGEGFPPAGCECEVMESNPRSAFNKWTQCKVIHFNLREGRETQVCIIDGNDDFAILYGNDGVKFRPLRTEAEKAREAAETAMRTCLAGTGAGITPMAAKGIYDAIAAGKIPGVKLEVK